MRINRFIIIGLIAVLLANISCSERKDVVFHGKQDHLLLKATTSSKEERRHKIEEAHEIVLFLGDNLADHHMLFEKRESAYGFSAVDSMAYMFGKQLIVFPNPMYGTWLEPSKSPDTGQDERARMVEGLIPW